MISIFDYTDYHIYLKDLINDRKKASPSFSVRGLSTRAGVKSPGFISMVISQKRNITIELAAKIAAALKLPKKEEKYFLLMVEYTHTKQLESKHDILEQMLAITRSIPVRNLLPEQFLFYEKWYYSVIREMVEILETNDTNCDQIASKLIPSISPRDVRQALDVLSKLNLIYKNQNGQYKRTDSTISCGEDIKSVIISNFQSSMIELASKALSRVPKNNRDFSTVTLSINHEAFLKIKQRCSAFRKDLLQIAKDVNIPDRIIQVNIQCFPVSNPDSVSNGEAE